jgi:hypothetical protein
MAYPVNFAIPKSAGGGASAMRLNGVWIFSSTGYA